MLTQREFELLQFLLDHPHRYYTSSQIMRQTPHFFPKKSGTTFSGGARSWLDWRFRVINRPGRGLLPHVSKRRLAITHPISSMSRLP